MAGEVSSSPLRNEQAFDHIWNWHALHDMPVHVSRTRWSGYRAQNSIFALSFDCACPEALDAASANAQPWRSPTTRADLATVWASASRPRRCTLPSTRLAAARRIRGLPQGVDRETVWA